MAFQLHVLLQAEETVHRDGERQYTHDEGEDAERARDIEGVVYPLFSLYTTAVGYFSCDYNLLIKTLLCKYFSRAELSSRKRLDGLMKSLVIGCFTTCMCIQAFR